MSIYLLFVDGIGLGRREPENPFFTERLSIFERWNGGEPWLEGEWREQWGDHSVLFSVDATMGIEGLPQSGTGQASLFTGINCSKEAGTHFGPYPHSTSKPFLKEQSLFHRWIEKGGSPHFMNAYPLRFFRQDSRPRRWSCTTYMTIHSGLELNKEREVRNGRALTAELDQSVWRDTLEIDVPVISMKEAANRIVSMGEEHDLIMFEYFLTDKAGHRQDANRAAEILRQLNQFLGELMEQMRTEDTIILCSDHGNLEDLSVRTHTRNRVPMAVYGAGVDGIQTTPESISDLIGLVMEVSDLSGMRTTHGTV